MKKNMGNLDRVLRAVVAIGLATAIAMGKIQGPVAIGLGLFAVVFLITSVVSYCPLYSPFGISTCHNEGNEDTDS